MMKPRRAGERESDAALLGGLVSLAAIGATAIAVAFAALR
jgi:hypothetical protein